MILPRGPGHRLRYRTGLWRYQNPPSSKHLKMAETLQFSGGKTYGNKWVNGLVFWEKTYRKPWFLP
jgi:hypothetical protein